MITLKSYNEIIVKYDLLNKFCYKNIGEFPKLISLNLSFNNKKYDLKFIVASLVALELITLKKGQIIFSKKSIISLKVRKGNPIGCRVSLTKRKMYEFLSKLLDTTVFYKKKSCS